MDHDLVTHPETAESLDEKLARVARRLEARRAELQSRLQTRPELAALLEGWKTVFGPLRISHIAIDDYTDGDPQRIYEVDERPGVVIRSPAPYHPPRRRSAAQRREVERETSR